MNKVLISIIRNHMPTVIANQIAGIQPMPNTASSIFSFDGSTRKDEMTIGYSIEHEQQYWAYPDLGGLYSRRHTRYNEIKEWCNNTFGKHTKEWNNPRWSTQHNKYYFKNEKDRMLFVMKWS